MLKLEKRLDDELLYLRDAPDVHSTVPFDLEATPHPKGAAVPINSVKVKYVLWTCCWHRVFRRVCAGFITSGIIFKYICPCFAIQILIQLSHSPSKNQSYVYMCKLLKSDFFSQKNYCKSGILIALCIMRAAISCKIRSTFSIDKHC